MVSLNTEDIVINEGMVRFDVLFYVAKVDGSSSILVDIEAQKDCPKNYPIYDRAQYYVDRLGSSQKNRDFLDSQYGNRKNVASIWIMMNTNGNSFSGCPRILKNYTENVAPINYHENGSDILFVGIDKEVPAKGKGYELHRFLGVLLSPKLDYKEKIAIMESEYPEVFDQNVREEMSTMCNLGEEREAIGYDKAVIYFVLQMNKQHLSLEQMMTISGKSKQEIKEIIDKYSKEN